MRLSMIPLKRPFRLIRASAILLVAMALAFVLPSCEKPLPRAERTVAVLLDYPTSGNLVAEGETGRIVGEFAASCPEGSFVFLAPDKTLESTLAASAVDPRVGAILVYPAPVGTAEAFQEIRSRRPDLLLMAGLPGDDPLLIEASADLVAMPDFAAMAFNAVDAAKRAGLRGVRYARLAGARSSPGKEYGAALAVAAKQAGLPFIDESFADGGDGLKALALARVSAAGSAEGWAAEDEALVPALVAACLAKGSAYLGSPSSSPTLGIPESLGLPRPEKEAEALALLDKAAKTRKVSGLLHSWPCAADGSVAAAMAELARRLLTRPSASSAESPGDSGTSGPATSSAQAEMVRLDAFESALRAVVPGKNAVLSYRLDPASGTKARNAILVLLPLHALGSAPGPEAVIPSREFRFEVEAATGKE